MEQTPATRFVDVLGRLGYKTQQAIADLLDIARPTAGTIVRYEKPPSFESIAKLKDLHPEVNMEWIFTGNGTAFVTGDAAPLSQLPPAIPSEAKPYREGMPAVPGTATPVEVDFVGKLIERLENELADAKAREEAQARMIETLLGKSPASAYAAIPAEPRQEVTGFRTAATLPTGGKVIAMWAPVVELAEVA